jgi:hypothetical protein
MPGQEFFAGQAGLDLVPEGVTDKDGRDAALIIYLVFKREDEAHPADGFPDSLEAAASPRPDSMTEREKHGNSVPGQPLGQPR